MQIRIKTLPALHNVIHPFTPYPGVILAGHVGSYANNRAWCLTHLSLVMGVVCESFSPDNKTQRRAQWSGCETPPSTPSTLELDHPARVWLRPIQFNLIPAPPQKGEQQQHEQDDQYRHRSGER